MEGSASPRKPSVAIVGEIAVGDFRGGVALDGEREILGAHAAAVVDDADEPPPALLDGDVDARRAGVERVLDELLHGGGRTLDHLAGGDAVDEKGIETADAHKRVLAQSRNSAKGASAAARARPGPSPLPAEAYGIHGNALAVAMAYPASMEARRFQPSRIVLGPGGL